jgi:outer membrane immunogenic protein
MKRIAIALLAVTGVSMGLSQLASAADLPVKARQPARQQPAQQAPASTNWSGTQIGGNGGGSVANNAFVEPGSVACWPGSVFGTTCTETPFSFSGQGKSFVGGGFVGYNVQMANTVVGVEGDALWKKATTSSSQQSTALGPTFCDPPCSRLDSFTGSISQGFEASIRARGGFLVTPSTLIYGTAGISFGQVSGSFTYQGILNVPPGSMATASGSWSDFRIGPTAGAGVETAIGPGLKLRLEYRYTSYGSYSKDIPLNTVCTGGGCVFPSANSHINVPNVYNQKLMVGIGYNLRG